MSWSDADEDLRANARFNREQWELAKRGPAATVVNGTTYTAEMAFDLIVNGALFHTDEDKAARWEMLPPFMQALMRNSMHDFVIDGLNVLYPTRNLVTEALEKGLLAFS